jgi:hypothetical protein
MLEVGYSPQCKLVALFGHKFIYLANLARVNRHGLEGRCSVGA